MKKTIVSALSLALTLAAGSALAADMDAKMPPKGDEGMKHHPMFKEADTNDDGFLSKDEWKAKGDKMFSEIDTNNDGKISPDEMKAHHEKRREMMKEHREERHEKMGEMKEKMGEMKEKMGERMKERMEKKAGDAAPAADAAKK